MASMESGSPVSTRAKSALTPQDHITRRAARNSRVHFDEDGYIPQLQEANPIQVQVTGEELSKTIGVYLGFLQEEHKYDVKFSILNPLIEGYLVMVTTSQPPKNSSSQRQMKIEEETSAQVGISNIGANGESREDSKQANISSLTTTSSIQKIKLPDNLELFRNGESCQVVEMEWGAAGLQVHMNVIVPSTKDRHVLEDTFCIRSTSVADRFVRVNVAAKIMGKTMGTPTLKDSIRCLGVCSESRDSSDSDCSGSDNENQVKDSAALNAQS